jgi:hypothetical protein
VVEVGQTRHHGGVTALTPDESPPTDDDTSGAGAVDETSGGVDPGLDRDPPKRRIDKTLLIVSFFVAVGLMLVIRGFLIGVTGDDRANLPDAIESVNPVPESVRVLSQTSVFVDLAPGYTGRFEIDDVKIDTVGIDEIANDNVEPGQQIALPLVTIYEPGNATLTFTPAAGAPIEQFDEGIHEATVIFWRIEDGPSRSRTYTWTFNTA